MTIFSGRKSLNLMPLGLIAISPVCGSRPLTLPEVQATRLLAGNSWFSAHTSILSCSSFMVRSVSASLALDLFESFHDIVFAPAKIVVQGLVFGVKPIVDHFVLRD